MERYHLIFAALLGLGFPLCHATGAAPPAIKPGENELEIEVVNNWPNRLIGDGKLPNDQRHTRTNIVKYNGEHPLQSSGLLGPVTIQSTDSQTKPTNN